MSNTENYYQWYIITVIGRKEDSIIDVLKEKITNFGYNELVKDIKIFKEARVFEKTFTKTDLELPKNLKNTKTTRWETLPNGSYKRIKTSIVNKFPGYVFINMVMNPEIWYCIRNTNGVLGFVGSSGKGALPIPISISEYEVAANIKLDVNQQLTQTEKAASEQNIKKVYQTDIKVGNTVILKEGAFVGEKGVVKSNDLNKGTAIIQIEVFGRNTNIEMTFSQLELDNK